MDKLRAWDITEKLVFRDPLQKKKVCKWMCFICEQYTGFSANFFAPWLLMCTVMAGRVWVPIASNHHREGVAFLEPSLRTMQGEPVDKSATVRFPIASQGTGPRRFLESTMRSSTYMMIISFALHVSPIISSAPEISQVKRWCHQHRVYFIPYKFSFKIAQMSFQWFIPVYSVTVFFLNKTIQKISRDLAVPREIRPNE